MAGVFKLEITETAEQLKSLLSEQKTVEGKERVQALYLLKLGQVKTIQQLAVVMGRDRTTVHSMAASLSLWRDKPTAATSGATGAKTRHTPMGTIRFKETAL
jgi:hypothetical protein